MIPALRAVHAPMQKALATVHLADVREKRSALGNVEQALAFAIDGCAEELSLCTILEMLDIGRTVSPDVARCSPSGTCYTIRD